MTRDELIKLAVECRWRWIARAKAAEERVAGLNTVAQILRQQTPEKPRIVVAPAIPKEFLTRDRPDER